MHEHDEIDLRILRTMQLDGSLSITEVAERIGLSQSPCSRRVSRLMENGIILGKTVILDRKKLGVQRHHFGAHQVDIARTKVLRTVSTGRATHSRSSGGSTYAWRL